MFDLIETDRFSETIKISMPGNADAGFITAHYRMIGRDEVDVLQKKSVKSILDAVLVGWEYLQSGGEDLPFNKKNLAQVANHPVLSELLILTYVRALSGAALASVQVKN
ncbi:MAG: hypothetical protein AAF418_00060 [Pseudomonadota bacterium]